MTVLRVVVASPGDVQPERDAVPEVLNPTICRYHGIYLVAVRWETDSYPGFHPLGAQGLVDPICYQELRFAKFSPSQLRRAHWGRTKIVQPRP